MSYSNSQKNLPRAISLLPPVEFSAPALEMEESGVKTYVLPIHGQGVFLFSVTEPANLEGETVSISFWDTFYKDGLRFTLGVGTLELSRMSEGAPLATANTGLVQNKNAFYWISLDAHQRAIKFGVGEARLETMSFQYVLEGKTTDENHELVRFLEKLTTMKVPSVDSFKPIKLLRDPIVQSSPLRVKNTEELTMGDIANNSFLPKSNLSTIAQKLYDNVAGKRFVLDDESFPQFSQAIEYSIANPNGWCNATLIKKSGEFGEKNLNKTYLRITLGVNSGESPGVPYVMEIWPPGHYSPIHNHAGANAIIRVLHGAISVKLFPFLGTDDEESVAGFAVATFSKDDITWISPEMNQIHQLKNLDGNVETCITIQCYMYDAEDQTHYDYFDYLGTKGNTEHYEPDSDADFVWFKAQMKSEWDAHLKEQEEQFLKSNL